jgi:hypothetical protein
MTVVTTSPRSPEDQELQALIEEARRRARIRRRRNGIAAALAVIVAGGTYALVAHGAGHGASSARESSATVTDPQPLEHGPVWYMRAITALHEWMPAGGTTFDRRGYAHRHGPEVLFNVRLTEETWVAVDGTMRDRVTANGRFASAAGRATWAAYGRPVPNFNVSGWLARDAITVGGGAFPPQLWYPWGEALGPYGLDLGDSLFNYRQLRSLPADPHALLAEIKRADRALARRENRVGGVGYEALPGSVGELTDIGGLLASPVPAAVRAALLRAAERVPGVSLNPNVSDPLGRRGESITATAGMAMQRLIFDPATGALLVGPKGTIVSQGIVGSLYALPRGTAPLQASGGPPVPAALAITPRIGGATTSFRLRLLPVGGRRAPRLDWVIAGTAGQQCFARGAAQPLRAVGRTGAAAYTYVLGPGQLGRQTWCPGRYELQVVPDYARRPASGWQPGTPGPSFSSGIGTSIYLAVK